MVLLDTNFVYSLFTKNDSLNKRAIDIFDKFESSERILIPRLVVAELLISNSKIDYIDVCNVISQGNIIDFDDDNLEFVSSLEPIIKKTLKSNDCLILSMAILLDAELITFDKKLLKVYSKLKNIKL